MPRQRFVTSILLMVAMGAVVQLYGPRDPSSFAAFLAGALVALLYRAIPFREKEAETLTVGQKMCRVCEGSGMTMSMCQGLIFCPACAHGAQPEEDTGETRLLIERAKANAVKDQRAVPSFTVAVRKDPDGPPRETVRDTVMRAMSLWCNESRQQLTEEEMSKLSKMLGLPEREARCRGLFDRAREKAREYDK